jgi:glyoxylase-like metal-dependent hydrolase (beta-lactamase superfamily II)
VLIAGIPSAIWETNCWVVAAGDGEQCLVVDPGADVGSRLEEILAGHRLHPVAVLLTHGHIDHTYSVVPVCQAHDVPAYIHPSDRPQLTDPWSWLGLVPGTPLPGLPQLTFAEPDDVRELADTSTVGLAGLSVAVRHTPGHTAGSVIFALPGDDEQSLVFSGDLVFAGSIGRVDLPGGSMDEMQHSLKAIVLPMDDGTVIYPGHGPTTTVGRERMTNPFLRELA